MGFSAAIKIDRQSPRKDGNCAIYMQVIVNRRKARLQTSICWPVEKFNEKTFCKPRYKNDGDYEQYNIIINSALSKANEIRKDYLLRGLSLTLECFLKEYSTDLNKNDFIEYFAKKSFERWNKGAISNETYQKEKGTLKKIKKFYTYLPFHEFNPDWANEFDRKLKRDVDPEDEIKKEISINGRWPRHKHVVTYLNIAKRLDNIKFNNPYERFKVQLQEGGWKPIPLEDFKRLMSIYIQWKEKPLVIMHKKKDTRPGLNTTELIVLRRFLFSCNCSLRISDLQKLDRSMFDKGQMTITPHKTKKYGTKLDAVPLNDLARMLLDDELNDNPTGRVFDRFSNQYSNRVLKNIAAKFDLDINLHHHVARYTFASIMDQAGANHTSLMKFMGLKKRNTLEKYVKTNRKVMEQDLEKMNNIIK
jgi:integrase